MGFAIKDEASYSNDEAGELNPHKGDKTTKARIQTTKQGDKTTKVRIQTTKQGDKTTKLRIQTTEQRDKTTKRWT
jgi:hypothetical protein